MNRGIIKTVKGGEKMHDKLTDVVITILLAISISKEVREWYIVTKKEKRQIPVPRKHRK